MTEMKSLTLNDKTYDCFVDSVARSKLEAAMVIGSESGEVIAVPDASNYNLIGLRIFGKTTQDGTPTPDAPVDLVSAGKGGALTVNVCGKNLLKITQATTTSKGVTFTVNGDGSVVVNGTATDDVFFHVGTVHCFANTKYRLTGGPSGGSNNTSYLYYVYGNGKYAKDYGDGVEFTPEEDINDHDVIITVVSGVTVSNKVFWPMLSLASVADTEYELYKGRTITVSTPNGLLGIPVASGGNYTDANGQQWVCDEKDYARGVYVQRLYYNRVPNTGWTIEKTDPAYYEYKTTLTDVKLANASVFSSHFARVDNNRMVVGGNVFLYARFPVSAGIDTLEKAVNFFTTNAVSFIATMLTPIETPLSEEELSAYADLHTYRNNTTVYNDAGAWMDLEYVMDAKKYIDSLVGSSTIHQATVE